MGQKFDIEVGMRGKDQGAGSLVDSMAAKLRMLRKEQAASGDRALGRAITGGNLTKNVGELLGIGKLGIAGAVLDRAGEGLHKVAESLKEVREGKKDMGDVAVEVMRTIPVFGQFAGGLYDIGMELGGTNAKLAEQQRELSKSMRAAEATAQTYRKLDEAIKAIHKTVNQEGGLLGSVKGDGTLEGAELAENLNYATTLKTIKKERQKVLDSQVLTDLQRQAELKKLMRDEELADQNHQQNLMSIGLAAGDAWAAKRRGMEQERLKEDLNLQGQELRQAGKGMQARIDAINFETSQRQRALRMEEVDARHASGHTDEMDEAFAKRRKDIQEEADREIALLKQDAQRRGDAIESETMRMRIDRATEAQVLLLKTQGKFTDASIAEAEGRQKGELERIRQEYEEKIREAETGEEKLALAKQQKAEEAGVRNKTAQDEFQTQLQALDRQYAGSRGIAATSITSNFHGLAQMSQDRSMAEKRTKTLELMLVELRLIKNNNSQGGISLGYNPP